ncbi:MAG: hypothetical protein AABZ46_00220 [Nitrospirota bacterium]
MLKRKETVIYLTIVFTFLIGVFIFVPAVAIQKKDAGSGDSPSQAAGGKAGGVFSDDSDTDIRGIMKALEDRERELSKREEALKKEEERLNMLRNSIELSLKQYSSLRDKMPKGIKENKSQAGIMQMARIYESMSVEEAAQRIEKMDADLAVNLLSTIKSKLAGKILGAITAEKAASLSARIVSKKVEN